MRATLLTLAPTFPTLTSPCDPAVKPGFLSWGCPKIALPSFKPSSPTPGPPRHRVSAAPRRAFEMGTPIPIRVPSPWFLTTSTVFLHDPATVFQAAADPRVHRVSSCRETGFPAMHLPPFEAFPPPTATGARISPGSRGPASPPRPSPVSAFTANLAPSPFFLNLLRTVSRRVGSAEAGAPRPCSIVGSVARSAVAGCARSVLPWAWPVRPPPCSLPEPFPRKRVPGARQDHVHERISTTSKTTPRSGSSVLTPGFPSVTRLQSKARAKARLRSKAGYSIHGWEVRIPQKQPSSGLPGRSSASPLPNFAGSILPVRAAAHRQSVAQPGDQSPTLLPSGSTSCATRPPRGPGPARTSRAPPSSRARLSVSSIEATRM